ncbi:unnamed protein product [Gemmataceae bacterium]|nr:unnamed protein product [Gemmataceae bacterium]VTT97604.1 unnamed protein product [Gemmataceae bacterium]
MFGFLCYAAGGLGLVALGLPTCGLLFVASAPVWLWCGDDE